MIPTDPLKAGDIVFLGDSLTEGFNLRKYFTDKPVKNRGISGDTTANVKYRLQEILSSSPSRIFLMIGINDLFNGYDPETVAGETGTILGSLIHECPGSEIFLQSILPVNEDYLMSDNLNSIINRANDLLKIECTVRHLTFLDLHSHFLNRDGQLSDEYTLDGAHLTERAYRLWADLISGYVK